MVVRRALAPDGLIAVGIRGPARSQRHPWFVTPHEVMATVRPEDLAVNPPVVRDIPAMGALVTVRTAMRATGAQWGPTGSVGFELASSIPTATADSDLDLVVRASSVDLSQLSALHRLLVDLDVRGDCQIETRAGAVALAELVSTSTEVMVRTPSGPRLLARAVAS